MILLVIWHIDRAASRCGAAHARHWRRTNGVPPVPRSLRRPIVRRLRVRRPFRIQVYQKRGRWRLSVSIGELSSWVMLVAICVQDGREEDLQGLLAFDFTSSSHKTLIVHLGLSNHKPITKLISGMWVYQMAWALCLWLCALCFCPLTLDFGFAPGFGLCLWLWF